MGKAKNDKIIWSEETYNFSYHYNTYSKKVGAMTQKGVIDYFNGVPNEWATGATREEAREALIAKMTKETVTV